MNGASVIFHSREMAQASPAVHGHWLRPAGELVLESGVAGGFGNDVGIACAHFIEWCLSRRPEVVWHLAPVNLPGFPWRGAAEAAGWYERLMAELAGWSPPPVLVDLDGYAVTQGGAVLRASPFKRHAELGAAADGGA